MDCVKLEYIKGVLNHEYEVCIWGAGFLGTRKGLELLSKRGISADLYCDNNPELWGKEIINGVKCISPKELQERKQGVICFLFLASSKVPSVLKQMTDLGIERIILFDELFEEEKEAYFPFMQRKKIAVYTCIVGEYDKLLEPLSISPDCDYYIISDRKIGRASCRERV